MKRNVLILNNKKMEYFLIQITFSIAGFGAYNYFENNKGKYSVGYAQAYSFFFAALILFVAATIGYYMKIKYMALSVLLLMMVSSAYVLYLEWRTYLNKGWFYDILIYVLSFLYYCYIVNPGNYYFHGLAADMAAYMQAVKEVQIVKDGGQIHVFTIEILKNAKRIGLVGTLGEVYSIFGGSVIDYLLSMVYAFYFNGIIVFVRNALYVFDVEDYGVYMSVLLLLLINVNILYLIDQAFLPQVISVIVFSNLVVYEIRLRNAIESHSGDLKVIVYLLCFMALMLSAVMVNYSEIYVLCVTYLFAMMILDFIKRKEGMFTYMICLVAVIAVSMLIVYPHVSEVYNFTKNNASNFRRIGYPFPNYMMLSDIAGLTNIFSDSKRYLDDAVASKIVYQGMYAYESRLLLSVVVAVLMIYMYLADEKGRVMIYVSTILLLVYFINIYLYKERGGVENYLYDKIALVFSTIILVFIIIPLVRKSGYIYWGVYLIFMVFSVISFNYYIKDRYRYSDVIPKNISVISRRLDSIKHRYVFATNERGYRNGSVIGKYRYIDRTNDFVLSSLLDLPMMDQWNIPQWESLPRGRRLGFIIRKEYLKNSSFKEQLFVDKVIDLGGGLSFVSTNVPYDSIRGASNPGEALSKYYLR